MKKLVLLVILAFTVSVLNAQNNNPINYHFNGTPVNGVKIKTNLPYTKGQMPTVIIEGYNYGKSSSIGVMLNWYVYNGAFIRLNASSHGSYAPKIKLANENGKVVIFIDERHYYNRFTIRTFEKGLGNSTYYDGWTTVDEPLTGSNVTDVPYKTWVSQNDSNVTFIEGKKVGIGVSNPTMKLELGNLGSNDGIKLGTLFQMRTSSAGSNNIVMEKLAPTGNFYLRSKTSASDTGNLVLNDKGGNVGIGTANPATKLEVIGRAQITDYSPVLFLKRNVDTGGYLQGIQTQLKDGTDNFYFGNYGSGQWIISKGKYSGQRLLTVKDDGNVGIGTVTPGAWKLAVNGNIRAKEIKVETDWSDFVFEDDYLLPTLKEVEQHIQDKGHLQDIPSAEEVAENGIFLGEMDSKLLQKIEELMLYTIEQNKRIELLEKENVSFKKALEELKEK